MMQKNFRSMKGHSSGGEISKVSGFPGIICNSNRKDEIWQDPNYGRLEGTKKPRDTFTKVKILET